MQKFYEPVNHFLLDNTDSNLLRMEARGRNNNSF